MKKSFLIFLIVVFALAGVASALTIVPHVHGNDFNHSKHHECPVYQAGKICLMAQLFIFAALFVFLVSRRYFFHETAFFNFVLTSLYFLRGPPVLI